METKKRTTRKLDLLTAVEQIVELSKESHLDEEFFKGFGLKRTDLPKHALCRAKPDVGSAKCVLITLKRNPSVLNGSNLVPEFGNLLF